MTDNKNTQSKGFVLPVVSLVLAIIGIFAFGFVFVPLAVLLNLIATILTIKNKQLPALVVAVVAWVCVVVGIFTSPILLAVLSSLV